METQGPQTHDILGPPSNKKSLNANNFELLTHCFFSRTIRSNATAKTKKSNQVLLEY